MSASRDGDQQSNAVRGVPRLRGDVHEPVIEQLVAVRLTLRGVEGGLNGGPLASRLRDAIAELDDATRQLRAPARRRLRETPTGDGGLADRLLEVVREASLRLGIAPALQFSGMDVAVPDDVEAALRAVLRRALTDVGQPTADVEVRVIATADRLTAQVTGYDSDDQGGDDPRERRQQGTRVTWTVPLRGLHAVPEAPPTAALPAQRRSVDGRAPRS